MAVQVKLNKLFTPKQMQVIEQEVSNHDWTLMINEGAIRSGKTFVNNFVFMFEIRRAAAIAKKKYIEIPQYILAGHSSTTIDHNVLTSIANTFGVKFKFDQHNGFKIKFPNLPAVKVVQAYTGNKRGVDAIRGMDSFGAYINEATLADESVFTEIRNRCSEEGARVICDTNPGGPNHWLKRNYIDKAAQSDEIVVNHFTLMDNAQNLSEKYIKTIKETTPSGMFYDRAILGLWVAGDGVVYSDFDKDKNMIPASVIPSNLTYFAGVDWGYNHFGSIVVLCYDSTTDTTYFIEEHTRRLQEIDYWVDVAKDVQRRYNDHMTFYCDSARDEHVQRFIREGINAVYADKSRIDGIESVAKAFKTRKLLVSKDENVLSAKESAGDELQDNFLDEIYQYVWKDGQDETIKDHDHCLTGDTMVETTNGDFRIDELVGKNGYVHSFDTNNWKTSIDKFSNVRKTRSNVPVYELELENGKKIKATYDHLILTENGYKALGELTPKDAVISTF
ncbi:PBSX family phage terminase large subunit (plasmid) [Fructilactobacillus ixorae]|uniref:PBSX family phage terminase large subunit n=1 Tax=Fructilactobacillus ixorae TaxID=1750535 RepID=A0ABY5C5E5_9LACO|nr:PBSX family phage terminase large subunit [Fructilactobacillus ixorae]USS93995.1 PBSX family phage terminase large subunit [Fructilactobacillus ixorae]